MTKNAFLHIYLFWGQRITPSLRSESLNTARCWLIFWRDANSTQQWRGRLWCRCRGWKRIPKSFDLSKIWAKSLKTRTQMFRHHQMKLKMRLTFFLQKRRPTRSIEDLCFALERSVLLFGGFQRETCQEVRGPFERKVHYSYFGPLCKQGIYALQLLLGAPLKAK